MSGAFWLTESPQISTLTTWRTKSTTLNKSQRKIQGKGGWVSSKKGKREGSRNMQRKRRKEAHYNPRQRATNRGKKDFRGHPTPDSAPNNYQLAKGTQYRYLAMTLSTENGVIKLDTWPQLQAAEKKFIPTAHSYICIICTYFFDLLLFPRVTSCACTTSTAILAAVLQGRKSMMEKNFLRGKI